MNVKLIIVCIVSMGLALLIGKWHQDERIKNRMAGKPWHADYLNIPSLLILMILTALFFLRYYVAKNGGINF